MTNNIEVLRGLVAKWRNRISADRRDVYHDALRDAYEVAADELAAALAAMGAPQQPEVQVVAAWIDGEGRLFDAAIKRENLPADARPLYTAAPKVAGGVCSWRQQDESGDWVSTGCGREFVLNDARQYTDGDAPFPFCAYCAKPMKFYRWRDESPCTCDNSDGPECEGCADNKRCAALAAHQREGE